MTDESATLDEPLQIEAAEDGRLILKAPGGFSVSLTAEAAAATARRLSQALSDDDAQTYQKPLG